MNFIAIVVALALEQWRAFRWRASVERAFVHYARYLESAMNGGTRQQGARGHFVAAGFGHRRSIHCWHAKSIQNTQRI